MLDSFYLQYLFGGFVSLIVITNPLSKIPLFISLTQGMSLDVRKKQANWSCYYAAAIMLVSLAAGNLLLVFFGISYGALRISGGFVVGIIGYQMLFGSRDQGVHRLCAATRTIIPSSPLQCRESAAPVRSLSLSVLLPKSLNFPTLWTWPARFS